MMSLDRCILFGRGSTWLNTLLLFAVFDRVNTITKKPQKPTKQQKQQTKDHTRRRKPAALPTYPAYANCHATPSEMCHTPVCLPLFLALSRTHF